MELAWITRPRSLFCVAFTSIMEGLIGSLGSRISLATWMLAKAISLVSHNKYFGICKIRWKGMPSRSIKLHAVGNPHDQNDRKEAKPDDQRRIDAGQQKPQGQQHQTKANGAKHVVESPR